MGIILNESPHTSQPGQSTRCFIAVNEAELGHAYRQLLVTAVTSVEDETVAGAVHRLERPFLLLNVEREHVVLVVLPVSGGFPQFGVVHVGGDD